MIIKPTISIIVPFYNAEHFIKNCIESILKQSYADFELILINDGSTDNSRTICNNLAQKDSRIRVYHKENEGVSIARNFGIDLARGKYLTFIDSDDWIENQYLNDFITTSLKYDEYTFVIQGVLIENKEKKNQKLEFPNLIFKQDLSNLFEKYNIVENGYVFAKFYNRMLIKNNNIRFHKDISIREDLLFLLEYLNIVKQVLIVSSINYHYLVDNPNSLSKQKKTFKELYTLFISIKEARNKLAGRLNKKAEICINFILGDILIDVIKKIYIQNKTKNERINLIKANFSRKDLTLINFTEKKNIVRTLIFFWLKKRKYKLFDFLYIHALKIINTEHYSLIT